MKREGWRCLASPGISMNVRFPCHLSDTGSSKVLLFCYTCYSITWYVGDASILHAKKNRDARVFRGLHGVVFEGCVEIVRKFFLVLYCRRAKNATRDQRTKGGACMGGALWEGLS